MDYTISMPLDIAIGILLALFVPPAFGAELSPFIFIFALASALLPDVDMVAYLLRAKKSHDHRSWTHYPALYLPLAILVYILGGPLYATIFALGVYLHLIHDTIGLGWGVAWAWPITLRRFRFLSPTGSSSGGWELYRSWLPQQEVAMAEVQHDPSWIKTYYLRPNAIGFIEYGVLIVALVALYLYF